MIEVFSTNVQDSDQSHTLVQQLLAHFPKSKINFDLDDCDKILRVEDGPVLPVKIVEVLNANGYKCNILE